LDVLPLPNDDPPNVEPLDEDPLKYEPPNEDCPKEEPPNEELPKPDPDPCEPAGAAKPEADIPGPPEAGVFRLPMSWPLGPT